MSRRLNIVLEILDIINGRSLTPSQRYLVAQTFTVRGLTNEELERMRDAIRHEFQDGPGFSNESGKD